MERKLKVAVVGCGGMGSEHALAYKNLPGFEIIGLASRTPEKARKLASDLGIDVPVSSRFEDALALKPDVMSTNTYPDTHAEYIIKSLEAGCHIFVEKPIARTAKEADAVSSLKIGLASIEAIRDKKVVRLS